MSSANGVLRHAASQIGRHYARPHGTSPYGIWYADRVGDPVFRTGAWCAMFVSWAAWKAGALGVIPAHAYTPSGAAWFRNRGQWHTRNPRRGDLVYYQFSGPRIHHVGLVEQVHADGSITAIEGNTSGTSGGSQYNGGMVARKRRRTGIVGYGRPAYTNTPEEDMPLNAADKDWLRALLRNHPRDIPDERLAGDVRLTGRQATARILNLGRDIRGIVTELARREGIDPEAIARQVAIAVQGDLLEAVGETLRTELEDHPEWTAEEIAEAVVTKTAERLSQGA